MIQRKSFKKYISLWLENKTESYPHKLQVVAFKMELKTIISEINRMANLDQKVRNQFYSQTKNGQHEYEQIVTPIDIKHTKRLKEIIIEIGYPTISKVGAKASFDTWLIIQHSPDISFMEYCLDLMRKVSGDINPQNIAYLEDRINMFHKKPQQYGTQLRENVETGKLELYEILDIHTIDNDRKSVGLNTLEEYLKLNKL